MGLPYANSILICLFSAVSFGYAAVADDPHTFCSQYSKQSKLNAHFLLCLDKHAGNCSPSEVDFKLMVCEDASASLGEAVAATYDRFLADAGPGQCGGPRKSVECTRHFFNPVDALQVDMTLFPLGDGLRAKSTYRGAPTSVFLHEIGEEPCGCHKDSINATLVMREKIDACFEVATKMSTASGEPRRRAIILAGGRDFFSAESVKYIEEKKWKVLKENWAIVALGSSDVRIDYLHRVASGILAVKESLSKEKRKIITPEALGHMLKHVMTAPPNPVLKSITHDTDSTTTNLHIEYVPDLGHRVFVHIRRVCPEYNIDCVQAEKTMYSTPSETENTELPLHVVKISIPTPSFQLGEMYEFQVSCGGKDGVGYRSNTMKLEMPDPPKPVIKKVQYNAEKQTTAVTIDNISKLFPMKSIQMRRKCQVSDSACKLADWTVYSIPMSEIPQDQAVTLTVPTPNLAKGTEFEVAVTGETYLSDVASVKTPGEPARIQLSNGDTLTATDSSSQLAHIEGERDSFSHTGVITIGSENIESKSSESISSKIYHFVFEDYFQIFLSFTFILFIIGICALVRMYRHKKALKMGRFIDDGHDQYGFWDGKGGQGLVRDDKADALLLSGGPLVNLDADDSGADLEAA
eukprot:36356_1